MTQLSCKKFYVEGANYGGFNHHFRDENELQIRINPKCIVWFFSFSQK